MDALTIALVVGIAILLVLLIDRSGMNADATRALSIGVILVAIVFMLVKLLPG